MARRSTPLSPEAKRDRCLSILDPLEANAKEALRLAALVNRLNDRADVRSAFDGTYEAHALNAVFDALLRQLIIVVARMHDPYNPENDRGGDRASLPHLMHLLEDRDVIRLFMRDALSWFPGGGRDRDALSALKHIQRARVKYRRLQKSDAAKWMAAVKGFRNVHLAHSLFDQTPEEKLLYGYVGDLLRGTAEIIPLCSLGLKGDYWELEEYQETYREEADAFWKVPRLGMLVKKRYRRRDGA